MFYHRKHEKIIKMGYLHSLIFLPRFWPRNVSQSLNSVIYLSVRLISFPYKMVYNEQDKSIDWPILN